MDQQQLAPYVRLSEDDRPSDAPHLLLELEAETPRLWVDTPYRIHFTLRRDHDGHDQSCIFRWEPVTGGFIPSGFVLLHHTADGLEKVEVEEFVGVLSALDVLVVNGSNQYLKEFSSGDSFTFLATLPKRYQKPLVPGDRYELLWPGGEIPMLDWGTIKGHMKQELKPKLLPRLILPGGPRVSFTVEMERELPPFIPPPSPPPIEPSARVPEAPILSVTLDCAPTLTCKGNLDVSIKVTYHGLADGAEEARPIIFHAYVFIVLDIRLFRRRDNEWEPYYDDEGCFMIVDDPDVPVNVSRHEDFVSLRPGESWSTSYQLDFPPDMAVGEVWLLRYKGGTVDWWDWGDREEHAQTVVTLPCWIKSKVVEPSDNGGRPELVVPASNILEVTVVE